ncbi:MAG: hypothetical protein GY868_10300 [Deltaproteobacteria bacterium]|nr:hypothetical protein [Deltaproteobacteria bacterium]
MRSIKSVLAVILGLCLGGACTNIRPAEDLESSGCAAGVAAVTGEHSISSGGSERIYYLKLPETYSTDKTYPIVFAFHGFTSDYTVFSEGAYDLQAAVGEEAILVYPNALEINGESQWDYDADLAFFDDLYAELEATLCFDKSRVFAVGHSNGAGMTHTLGCERGNILRAIGPVSGSFADYEECTGQVAVMMVHGSGDPIMPLGQIMPTLEYWKSASSCSSADSTAMEAGEGCEAYAGCDSAYPVRYCEHSGGHDWPDGTGSALWDFFSGLLSAAPSSSPGSGTGPATVRGSAGFKVHFPSDFAGVPEKLTLSLYPAGSTMPLSVGPDYILSLSVPLGDYVLGETLEYADVRISMLGVDYGDYTIAVNIYVEGSNYPIPTSGKDYMGLQEISINGNTIVIEQPFELELLVYD